MKTINNVKPECKNVVLKDIPQGTYFYGSVNRCDDANELLLRTFLGVISLSYPSRSWTLDIDESRFTVNNYRPVDVTIIVDKYL